jgi:hypothetical protein
MTVNRWMSSLILVTAMVSLSPRASGLSQVESGIWWDVNRPGEALVVERQGGLVAFIIYSYTADGEPEFYTAAGALVEGGFSEPTGWSEGFLPLHQAYGPLYRSYGGPVLNSLAIYRDGDPPSHSVAQIGNLRATFNYGGTLILDVSLTDPPEGSRAITRRYYSRFVFGYEGFGQNLIFADLQAPRPCWVDLRGRWMFADIASATARESWSFDFSELDTSPPTDDMTCPGVNVHHTLLYTDTTTGATMQCVNRANGVADDGEVRYGGCEVRDASGSALFSFSFFDLSVSRLVGSRGPLPLGSTAILRTSERIIGVRID